MHIFMCPCCLLLLLEFGHKFVQLLSSLVCAYFLLRITLALDHALSLYTSYEANVFVTVLLSLSVVLNCLRASNS